MVRPNDSAFDAFGEPVFGRATLSFRLDLSAGIAPADRLTSVKGTGVRRSLQVAALVIKPAQVKRHSQEGEQKTQHERADDEKDALPAPLIPPRSHPNPPCSPTDRSV